MKPSKQHENGGLRRPKYVNIDNLKTLIDVDMMGVVNEDDDDKVSGRHIMVDNDYDND